MQFSRACEQDSLGLEVTWIGDAAIDRAYRGPRFMIVEADAFGAFGRTDVIDVLRYRRMRLAVELPVYRARADCGVGTFRLACSAVDTFARNRRRHLLTPLRSI